MKSLGKSLILGLLSMAAVAFAQSDMKMPDSPKPDAPKSEAQKSFDEIKTLAGTWEGRVTTIPPDPSMNGKAVHATLRVTSTGNAVIHEMKGDEGPDDPITMLYVDGDRLLLTHYCDAGNRPRMAGKMSADGKRVEFAFLDLTGGTEYGHMDQAVFTPLDSNHHAEDWTYMAPGDKPMHAHMDFVRTK